MNNRFLERIDKFDNIDVLTQAVCNEYNLGQTVSAKVIEIGYEDFNAIIETTTGKYLMKIFRNSRSDEECFECIERSYIAYKNGVPTPKVFENKKNEILTKINLDNSRFRVGVIAYIDGQDFFNIGQKPTKAELEQIVNIAASFSKIQFKPKFIYDSWAISSFCKEYEKKFKLLNAEDLNLVMPVYEKFKKFDYAKLPRSFVHGDMMSTNLMRDKSGKVWVIDFSVSNYTARLNEISVIADDVCLTNNEQETLSRINFAFNNWCKAVKATVFEKKNFLLIFSVANAINIMNSAYEIFTGNTSNETYMHYNAGKFGLKLISQL